MQESGAPQFFRAEIQAVRSAICASIAALAAPSSEDVGGKGKLWSDETADLLQPTPQALKHPKAPVT